MTMEHQLAPAATRTLRWGSDGAVLTLRWSEHEAVGVSAATVGGQEREFHLVPAVEILTARAGHLPASGRLAHTDLGSRLRYVDHSDRTVDGVHTLVVRQRVDDLEALWTLTARTGARAFRSEVTVTNIGLEDTVLRGVTSWSAGFTDPSADDGLADWTRITGINDWLGEGRWAREPLRGPDFVALAEHLTGHNPRGSLTATSDGTWSTGHHLPVGVLDSPELGCAIAWQIEHNGAWRWEIGEDTDGGYLTLSGPTDSDSGWSSVLAPGAEFTTVPVAVAFGATATDAVGSLTGHRRADRRPHPDNAAMPVVFNDYMNTLDGDPTTEKLLPLIAAAGLVGAEIFCIDAGWYDDSGHWWDTVGAWQPSTTRFPGGLTEVIDAIREAGMSPGLWLEPEVIGVKSPVADTLPPEAFLQRNGARIVEHHRFHLDLRHPAARAHLDEVVDRLVADLGIGFFKFDYNINPGPGTDLFSDSVGDGLLQHNRAHLAWLDGVLDRHPSLVIENCSSGAMRMDYALLSRLAMQSTSDQQDFLKYPPIAAAAPLSILPEQAASWAYPQPWMNPEEASFCLVTGLLGRFYVSGHLNRMSAGQRDRVAEAISVAKGLRPLIQESTPHWPLGLPAWEDDVVALGLRAPDTDLIALWNRAGATTATLLLPHLRGHRVDVSTEFPTDLPAWPTDWDAASGTLTVHVTGSGPAARTLRLAVSPKRTA